MMRVTLNIHAAYPELQSDMASVPARSRAERLRFLAGVGLAVLNARGITLPAGVGAGDYVLDAGATTKKSNTHDAAISSLLLVD